MSAFEVREAMSDRVTVDLSYVVPGECVANVDVNPAQCPPSHEAAQPPVPAETFQ